MTDTPTKQLPSELNVKRSDPVYMAHGYLTKVPIAAIQPYIEAFTSPGDVVLDPFAGSGMTGVAAHTLGRDALLYDVSILGRHIGTNYVRLVDAERLREEAARAVVAVDERLESPYETICVSCNRTAQTSKVTRSMVVECPGCSEPVSFYQALQAADWRKSSMKCPHCGHAVSSKSRRVSDQAELETVRCDCAKKLSDQPASETDWVSPVLIEIPSTEIAPDRQMYVASALGKHGLTDTRSFFSDRNATVLAALRAEIEAVDDNEISEKLLFAFTAILARASKRYQWSKARPLNASNSNYYVAPVFYEWNVFELFLRKVEAVIKSDNFIRAESAENEAAAAPRVRYGTASATELPLKDNSVDYVFTDPPFGWNIFYSDMNLFHEVWLGDTFTDPAAEAVIDRSQTAKPRTPERYEEMLVASLKECQRVLKPGGWTTLVFGNSSGAVWAVVQRAILRSGMRIDPETIASLHKGQRSVKGLASGFENVVTHDLIMSLRPHEAPQEDFELHQPSRDDVTAAVAAALEKTDSPSELYVHLLRAGLRADWDLAALDLKAVTSVLLDRGFAINSATGLLTHPEPAHSPS